MELSSAVFRDILSPLAAFKETILREENFSAEGGIPTTLQSDQTVHTFGSTQATSSPYQSSPNLEDTPAGPSSFPFIPATPHEADLKYRWIIQGADPDARRFFAVPQFALDKPPLRIDVYLPPLEEYLPEVRDVLKPEEVIYAPREEIPSLRISRWLAGVLERWCVAYDACSSGQKPRRSDGAAGAKGKFQREYESMPFGSRILVTIGGLSNSPGEVIIDHEIYLVPDYDVEQVMLTADSLREMWGDSHGNIIAGQRRLSWPEVIDLEDLHLKRQFHEAISVIMIDSSHYTSPSAEAHDESPGTGKEWIFKSLIRDQRYLYNELKMLLSLGPHENIIPKPRYIVTKKARFGGRKGVCGFVLEYFPGGSLKQFLLDHSASKSPTAAGIPLEQKLLWAKQITRALVHINTNTNIQNSNSSGDSNNSRSNQWFGFYPDLKPDNIILRPSSPTIKSTRKRGEDGSQSGNEIEGVLYDAVLIDLEQRGGWFSWSPPEISYLEYLEMILSADADELDGQGYDADQLEKIQEEVGVLLGEYYLLCFDHEGSRSIGTCDTGLGNGTTGWNGQSKGRNCGGNLKYYNSDGGFSTPWLALLAERKVAPITGRPAESSDHGEGAFDLEKAQVFMLGKLLWCIFEEEALMRCGIDHEMLSDGFRNDGASDSTGSVKKAKMFPEFEHTPDEIRALIKRCTAGADEWEDSGKGGQRGWRVVLNGDGKLVPAPRSGQAARGSGVAREPMAEDTQREATAYWKGEVEKARSFVAGMVAYEKLRNGVSVASCDEGGQTGQCQDQSVGSGYEEPWLLKQARSRPTLGHVLEVLESIWI